jgi:rSAM/selenodomain-associated transferase 2
VKLSVVIPTLNEADRIAESVASAASDAVEVLVVDGGSHDGTPERARTAGATVLDAAPGRARQLGVGASATRGDVILFLHADTKLPPGWDAAVRGAVADDAVVGGAFRFRFDARGPLLRVIEWGAWLRVRLFGLPYGDQALFVPRSTLEAMGGVPQAPIMEDLDLVREMMRTMGRNWLAAVAWLVGLERERIAAWYRR